MFKKLIFVFVLFFPVTAFCNNDAPLQKDIVYLKNDATINSEPNLLGATIEKIKKFEQVEILEKSDSKWLKVKTAKENVGWLLSNWVTKNKSLIKPDVETVPSTWDGFRYGNNEKYKKIAQSIEKKNWWELCSEFGRRSRSDNEDYKLPAQAIRAFFTYTFGQQKMIRERFLSNVKYEKVAVGMNTCEVYGALGNPQSSNTTETVAGVSTQLVYPQNRYIYTESSPGNGGLGTVTAIQH